MKQADGPSVPELRPTIQSETIEFPFDEPVALYHNAYLDGVDASKRGEIEMASALKLHYYLQCNKNEDIKTTASVIIDVGSLAVGVGAISGGVKGVRLVLAICDVASSTVSLLSTGSEKYLIDKYGGGGQAYVNSMQMISAVLGFADLGATGAGKLKNLLKDDVVTAGAFYAKHGTELANDAQTAELATQTKKIVDEFTDYDDEIARLIDNAGDLGGARVFAKLELSEFTQYPPFRNGANAEFAEDALNLYNKAVETGEVSDWNKLEAFFKDKKLNEYNGRYWPPMNGGYNNYQEPLTVGKKFDRYGNGIDYEGEGIPQLGGTFTSPMSSGKMSFEQRALAGNASDYDFYYEIEIINELPLRGKLAM